MAKHAEVLGCKKIVRGAQMQSFTRKAIPAERAGHPHGNQPWWLRA